MQSPPCSGPVPEPTPDTRTLSVPASADTPIPAVSHLIHTTTSACPGGQRLWMSSVPGGHGDCRRESGSPARMSRCRGTDVQAVRNLRAPDFLVVVVTHFATGT